MKYIIGLDIGIGSVGWAVVRNDDDCKRLEDFGVRIFESGEIIESNKNIRNSQRRRKYRGMRRRIRRRNHRKERLKNYLENIGFVSRAELSEFFAKNNHDIIDIRVRALDEKVTPVELTAALLHIAKRRGYKAFYELSDENNNAKDKKAKEEEEKDIYKALTNTADIIKNGGYRSIAEAIMKDSEHFSDKISGRYKYRNIKEKDEKGKKESGGKISENDILFPTEMFEDEVRKILGKQKEFYPQLTDESIDKIFDIIFSRRDFEDGPGNTDDENRPYKGFVDSIGNCPYYKNEKRGHRYTVIGDLFALANKLSQYKYVEKNTGEVVKLPRDLMRNIVNQSLQSGSITKTKINELAKELNIVILNTKTAKNENIADCIKYLKAVKPIFESYGFDWDKLISEEYTDQNSLLNRVGDTISFNITPKRRIDALNKIDELKGKDELIKKLSKQNFSGTAKVSDKYMIDAINAFFDGTLVGEFQANVQQDEFSVSIKTEKLLKLKPFDNNSEYAQNPVVFRAINETRKVVNAIVQKYGAPNAMNIEIASELNKSFDTRQKISTQQNKNEKERKNAIKQISLITGLDEREIRPQYIERYLLGELQGWRCMYSNEEITNKKEAILNKGKQYEIDHIVPFSRILDDTLNNKALVLARENQKKGARTPLMYHLSAEKEKEFKQRVNKLFKDNKITEKKYRYFMLESLVGEDAEKILGDWKTRNLNDTRYIAKFLVKYFNDNLYFAREKGDDKRPVVYAVKGAITSSLRRQWLNKETWGRYDKGELKKITYFDHAVDAIVIANCLPAYVIIAAENHKLRDIYYSAGKIKTEEYRKSLDNCVDTLMKYYGMSPTVSRKLLEKVKETPSLLKNIRFEVEYRVRDYELMKYFFNYHTKVSEDTLDQIFRNDLYKIYDHQFADSIEMPIVSIKPERKYSGQMVKDGFIKKKDAISGKNSVKTIGENNSTVLNDSRFYCVDVYRTCNDETNLNFIKYTDLLKKNNHLYLRSDYRYPDDYAMHEMYLFYGDYIEITKKNKICCGYYFSLKNSSRNELYMSKGNTRRKLNNMKENEVCSITKKDTVKKFEIDILGKKLGEVKKYGEPLSLLPEKN
jgi:CRISPR-associated endonuclease Csn1